MSAPSPASHSTALPTRPNLRPWLTALLPFTALGLLPWWVCLALSAALALGRLNDDSRSIGALIVLLAAVLVSGPMLLGTAQGRLAASGTLFAQAAVVGLLALASSRALENGQRRGLLLPAAALLLVPSPVGLAALLLAGPGLSGAETRPQIRLESRKPGRLGWTLLIAALLAAGVALLLQNVLLGHGASTVAAHPEANSTVPVARPQRANPAALPSTPNQAPGTRQQPQAAPFSSAPEDQALLIRPLVPVTALLMAVCLLLLIQRTRLKRAERRSRWTDYVAVAALALTLFMVGVLGAGTGPGSGLGGSPPAAAAATGGRSGQATAGTIRPAPAWITPLLNAGMIFATLFFAVAAVYLYRALQAGSADQEKASPGAGSPPAGTRSGPPLHRVRLAWRGLEPALAAAGLARMSSETPEEFSARLAGLLPAASADLHTLVRLYLPVRYGGELSEHDAARAEASAEAVRRAVAGWGGPNATP